MKPLAFKILFLILLVLYLLCKFSKCRNLTLLYNHQYWSKFKSTMENAWDNQSKKLKIKSYGLGSLEHNLNSRYQFVLLVLIIEELLKSGCLVLSVEFYDPLFTKLDKCLLTSKFNFKISDKNDEGKCCIENERTLLYMPHCGKALYNNVIFSNWSDKSLDNLFVIGNSFKTITSMEGFSSDTYKYICGSLKGAFESRPEERCEYTNGFNDMSITRFDSSLIDFSNDLGVPSYVAENEEIVFAS
jgi:hypothetical protein